MRVFDGAEVVRCTPWLLLVDAIADALRSATAVAPDRHVHALGEIGGGGSLLLMPSWDRDLVVTKTVTYFPSNTATDVPTVNAAVLVFDGSDGRHIATLDGDVLTVRRTAAIAVLASRRLARPEASRLLVVGTGQLAPNMARAHAAQRPLSQIEVWGRNQAKAEAVAQLLRSEGLNAFAVSDLNRATERAEIVSCVTGANEPILNGELLQPGTHVELIGSFAPGMRESDDAAVVRASLFVDTVPGAVAAGDLSQPIEAGLITEESILADLRDLVAGNHPGRSLPEEITLFKSAGFALADLAAARLALR